MDLALAIEHIDQRPASHAVFLGELIVGIGKICEGDGAIGLERAEFFHGIVVHADDGQLLALEFGLHGDGNFHHPLRIGQVAVPEKQDDDLALER